MTNSDTYQDVAKPSSYLETENLETQEKVINLGKKLLSTLKKDDDEITSWMINYLAEQITLAESGNKEAKKSCVEVILKIWERRATLPDGTRPFESFEPIFKAIESLNPESSVPRYYNQHQSDKSDELNESEKWVEIAKQLDDTAKTLITFMLEQAVLNSCSEETSEWLKTLNGTVNSNEYDFIRMYSDEKEINKTDTRIKNLSSRISKLEAFENLSQQIRQSLLEELKGLEK
ncbi:hypothetical protein [Pseudoalteromonas sp. Angola-18]|uniref:hypothetical protein n=1 Tax=Pseudoalteromonas sp. Angola-18 TaxID=3025338 RepID=UPI002358E542|nr:hypothetical protein [Pseudoalteromonas sp. Angola-18]MDC9502030.1 hypothetical protein [Pseudoalteromonas sp. Angola-18]